MTFPIPDAALDDRLAFIGTSGSGKTYNAGGALERLLATGARCAIVDPLGVWWGLRLTADGSPSKHNVVIFGGEHGDLPLNENAGKIIGETVATMAESCIVDLSALNSKAAERRFMLAFLEAVYRNATGDPLHMPIDEADMFAPQRGSDEPRLQALMEQIVRRGRIRGFIPWLITQRPAVLSKDVLSQADGLVAFKLTASQDRKALGDWVRAQADEGQWAKIDAQLPTMQQGQGIVWLPSHGVLDTVSFPAKRTFDSSRTPKRGERVERRPLKPLNLETLKGKLAAIEEEQKASDPRALKAEVARLTRELAKAEKAKAKPPAPASPPPKPSADVAALESRVRQLSTLLSNIAPHLRIAFEEVREFSPVAMGKEPRANGKRLPTPTVERVPEADVLAKEGLSKAQQKVLNAVAWWGAFGIDKPKREQVAFIAGYSPTSGGFYNLLGGLRTAGLIDYPSGGLVSLTEAGHDRADAPTVAPTRDAFHQHVRAKLSGSQLRVFDPILAAWPQEIGSDAVAEQAGYSSSSGGFFNLRGSLRTLGLIDYPSGGQCRAEDWLFP